MTDMEVNCIEAKCERNQEDKFYDLFIFASELMDCKDYNEFLNRVKYVIRRIKEEQTLKDREKDELLKHIDRCILYRIYAEMGLLQ